MLLTKPDICKPCPAYGDGKGFVGDDIVPGAPVTVLLQNPGPDEERGQRVTGLDQRNLPIYEPCDHKPAIGRTGHFMDTKLLPQAGLERGRNVSVLNVLKCRWTGEWGKKTNDLPTGKVLRATVDHCTRAHLRIPNSTRVVIAGGGLAWDYLNNQVGQPETRKLSISAWRGNIGGAESVSVPILGVLHPADLFRDRRMLLPSRHDWSRIPQILAGTWPLPLPPRLVIQHDTEDEQIHEWFDTADEKAPYLALDTEYGIETKLLTIVGVGYRDPAGTIHGIQLQWVGDQAIESRTRAVFRRRLETLVARKTVVMWNAQADIPVVRQNLGIRISYPRFEDGMLAHAALWSELPHDLDFCASVYSPYVKPKREGGYNLVKNWGDACATIACWEKIAASLKADPGAEADYKQQKLPLVSVFIENHEQGLRVNKPRVEKAIPEYEAKLDVALRIAQAACGWPVNVGSSTQMAYWVYTHGGLPKQIKRKTRKVTVDDDAVAELRNQIFPQPDFQDEKDAIGVDYILQRITLGSHPLLESRVLYAGARQVLSHYLLPLVSESGSIQDRIYPITASHSQDNGRLSISDPPLAQLPDDLRDLVLPDPGFVHIHWDWNAAEKWMQVCVTRSKFLESALTQHWDLNTLALCDLMVWSYPPSRNDPHRDSSPESEQWRRLHQWEGKDDPRRRLAKAGSFALDYGKLDLSTLPGIGKLGIAKADLKTAGERILEADPDKRRWMGEIKGRVKRGENISRDFTGARRVFLGTTADSMYREWLNHPFQRGVASLLLLTLVDLLQGLPVLSYAWSMHDAGDIACPVDRLADTLPRVKAIVEQERDIVGYKHAFKATWSVVYDDGRRVAA